MTSPGDSWMTPGEPLGAVLSAFGGPIDLDPCANPLRLLAALNYTDQVVLPDRVKSTTAVPTPERTGKATQRNGLTVDWYGRVYVNPPYSAPGPWVAKAIRDADALRCEVILLLPADTSTVYFHTLAAAASAMCFWARRVRFIDPATMMPVKGSPKFGSLLAYLGPRRGAVRAAWAPYGWVP